MSRVFIVGMGTTLPIADLDLLVGETTYGVGRTHLLFNQTIWRPDHQVLVDRSRNAAIMEDGKYHLDQGWKVTMSFYEVSFMFDYTLATGGDAGPLGAYTSWFWWKYPNILPLMPCFHTDLYEPTEWHFPHVCTFGGSGSVAIQDAVKTGITEIYLLGFDGHYDINQLHIVSDYETTKDWNEKYIAIQNRRCKVFEQIAFDECATRNVHLEKLDGPGLKKLLVP